MAVVWSIIDGNLPFLDDFPVQYDIEYTSDALWQISDGDHPYKKAVPTNYGFTDYSDMVWIIEDGDHPYKKAFPTMYPIEIIEDEWVSKNNSVPYRVEYPPMYISYSTDSWKIDDSIPYRDDFPRLIFSIPDINNEWVNNSVNTIPYRLHFASLRSSTNARHFWYIDDDIPFQGGFPPLYESIKIDPWYIDDDVPYRPAFPDLRDSIPGTDIWVSDGDIPFRLDFPELKKTVLHETWFQETGWDPYRPWPKHKPIIQEVQTIESVPDVDWTKSMKQDFEFYTVDPATWFDDKRLTNIISCNMTHDVSTDKRGNASITLTEEIPECYIRTYLVVTQNNILYKFCLGTFLYMTSSDSFDGMKHNITMTGYTPLVELEEQYPKLGYHVVGYTNRKYGSEAPMVTDEIRDIILENTRCEVESKVLINKPLLNDFIAGTNDNWLTVVNNILDASSLQSYILTVDEWGTIIIADAPTIDDVATTFTYNDDNSSILLPTLDTFDDIYGIPNVMEVLYVGDKNMPAIRVVVKNEDENSVVSTVARGREIVRRYTINNIAAPLNTQSYDAVYAQVEAQAYKLLEASSTIQKTISYSHGYCNVKVGDMVMLNYTRAGMNNVRAKVTSQRISCKPGCQVDETAVYTKKLWNRGV